MTELQNEPECTFMTCRTVLLTSTALTSSLLTSSAYSAAAFKTTKENKLTCIHIKKFLPVVPAEMKIHPLGLKNQYASCGSSHSHGKGMKGLEKNP